MTTEEKIQPPKLLSRIIIYETLGFIFIIVWCWLDEIFDLPALLFGADPSPANIVEAIEETVVIGIFGAMVVFTSYRLISRIKLLEGIVPTCSFCKKIRVGENWEKMEEYFSKRSHAKFSHGFCPTCMKEHYNIPS